MKSLRDLLHATIAWIRSALAPWIREHTRMPRPARGPAHPETEPALRARAAAGTPTQGVAERSAARPRLVPPPPHILALLARAPDVEPEFVPLAKTFRSLPARVRIYNPRPAPAEPRVAPRAKPALGVRIARAFDPVARWLVQASPSSRVPGGAPA